MEKPHGLSLWSETLSLFLSINYVTQSNPLCRQESSEGNDSFHLTMAPEVHQGLTVCLLWKERLKSWLIYRKSQKDGIRHFPVLFKTVQARQMAPMFKIRVQIPSTYMKSKTCPQVLVAPPLWRSGERETEGWRRLAGQPPGSVSP